MDCPNYVFIYGLKDPRDAKIYYIGKANDPQMRYRQHLSKRNVNKKRVRWIESLEADNLSPELIILEKVIRDNWQESEKFWIAEGFAKHWPLTNILHGGQGLDSFVREYFIDTLNGYATSEEKRLFISFDYERQKNIICCIALASIREYRRYPHRDIKEINIATDRAWKAARKVIIEELTNDLPGG